MGCKPFAYSESDVETMVELRQRGFTYKQIAERLSPRLVRRTPEAINTWFDRHPEYKLRRRKSEAKRDAAVSLKVGELLRANAPLSGS